MMITLEFYSGFPPNREIYFDKYLQTEDFRYCGIWAKPYIRERISTYASPYIEHQIFLNIIETLYP